jgi:hypothetical protein
MHKFLAATIITLVAAVSFAAPASAAERQDWIMAAERSNYNSCNSLKAPAGNWMSHGWFSYYPCSLYVTPSD